jgi:hypothetical protein
MLMDEDDHIAYINPFVMTILRSFAVNLFQLEKNNQEKQGKKLAMAKIKRFSHFYAEMNIL